ncbi:MAG: helix-turn-helix domain-containing protein [Acidobacteria bacterium]|nr:helix-turn-helix domain-containing protein [Acidobacteriota bacterium]
MTQIEGFRRALEQQVVTEKAPKRTLAIRGSYEGMIRRLEEEIEEYDLLKAGSVTIPPLERLDQIAPFIVRLRIAKGVSQTELASRLGVSKQVVSRNEDDDYQGVGLERLQSILDALGVRAKISLSA